MMAMAFFSYTYTYASSDELHHITEQNNVAGHIKRTGIL